MTRDLFLCSLGAFVGAAIGLVVNACTLEIKVRGEVDHLIVYPDDASEGGTDAHE